MPICDGNLHMLPRTLIIQVSLMSMIAVAGCYSPATGRPLRTDIDESPARDSGTETRLGATSAPEALQSAVTSLPGGHRRVSADDGPMLASFRRPSRCGSPVRRNDRKQVDCEVEERRDIFVDAEGHVTTGAIVTEPPRNPYPIELVQQWRYCPFSNSETLDRLPDSFMPYEDADIGRCYIHREIDTAEVKALSSKARLGALAEVHPYLADATSRMIVAAAREGFLFKVISTNRPYTRKSVTITKVIKKGNKMVKVKRKTHGKGSSLHAWGLAVDVNVMHRKDLGSATRAFLTDENERRMWERLGELGAEYGLIWLGPLDAGEIFHFEWRPGLPGRPGGKILRQLLKLKAKGGYPAVWTLLKCPNPAKSRFGHLLDLDDSRQVQ